MSKIAVDVVLLPSDEMTDKAIRANTELVEKFGSEIVLNKENCLPHISLAMGCINEQDISQIKILLEAVASENPIRNLKVSGVQTSINARGETVSVFEIEKTQELQSLHENIMKKVKPYFSYNVTDEMIYGRDAAETTMLWIENYPEKASFANYFPHITIGYGRLENDLSFPIEFIASRLALCHLGNHCTCRKILASIEL
jgi:2'-5' RNA ligase